MTREEAIERLKNYTQYRCGGVDLVAINMAIQALESQPRFLVHSDGKIEQTIEPCDDAVSREAVLKINENYHGKMPNHINFEIWNEIKALPSVLPKHEGNTVSEEVYTEEYLQRKKMEYELYVLKKKISELI